MSDRGQAASDGRFSELAERVVKRLTLAKWLRLVSTTALFVYPSAVAAALISWYFSNYRFGWFTASVVIGIHLLMTGCWAWLKRPSHVAALARWDEVAGRDEMFTSAYCFERSRVPSLGERLHVDKALARLDTDLSKLRADLPTPLAHPAWMFPLAFLGLVVALIILAPEPPAPDSVSESAKAEAFAIADELAKEKEQIQAEHLAADEQEQLKKLSASMDEMQDKLRQLDKETQRDVLAELEKRAHEAEQLAEKINAADLESLSSEMIAELERHADTTEFGSALRAEKLEDIAAESDELAERLEDERLALEEEERLEEALQEAMTKASKEDTESMVGQRLTQSLWRLQKEQPELAAEQFRKLAKEYRRRLQRKLTQKQLQQLAEQLRNSGQKMFGRQDAGIRQLAQNPSGLKKLGAKQLAQLKNMSFQPGQSKGAPIALAPPGAMPASPQNMAMMPIPGSGQPMAMIPGLGQNAGGQCPIPGTGGQMPGQGQGQGAGMSPVPGQGAGNGGLQAGQGSAGYGNTTTTPLAATRTGQVNAQIGRDGPAMLRTIEGGQHREDISRSARGGTFEGRIEEEAALADETLPLGRRQQVLRYFTALRRQLVDQSGDQP